MKLQILRTIEEMRAFSRAARQAGSVLGLVPTMGALHEGHLSLMRRAKEACDVVVASVFVNPTQFGPNEDFAAYPRDFASDCEKLEAVGVDAVFHPAPEEMYPQGYAAFVTVDGPIASKLCGARRPGHFRGVATVLTKLFHITGADKAFFGQKDAQQVVVIKRFARDLNFDIEIEMVPIVRAADGLALSSRNQYLSAAEREAALVLSRSLQLAQRMYADGERDAQRVVTAVRACIAAQPLAQIDYVELHTFPDLLEMTKIEGPSLLALAVQIGRTRLIDNVILGG